MTTKTILPAPIEVLEACDEVDRVVAAFLKSRRSLKGYGEFESSTEALLLFNLVVRQVEGVLSLARNDLVLLPAAMACARAAFETALKAAWMVNSNDPYLRETRWLAHLQEEERVYERAAKRWPGKFAGQAAQLREFRQGVEAMLPPQAERLKHNPTVDQMFEAFDGKQLYPLYIYMSQFVHGGHLATSLYRKGLGTMRQTGEYVSPSSWYLPIRMCWLALSELGSHMLWRIGSPRRNYITEAERRRIEGQLRKVQNFDDSATVQPTP